MGETVAFLGHGDIDALILQALVRRHLAKGVPSSDDVRALLFDAATRLDLVGSDLTPEAALIIVEEDLAPAFPGSDSAGKSELKGGRFLLESDLYIRPPTLRVS